MNFFELSIIKQLLEQAKQATEQQNYAWAYHYYLKANRLFANTQKPVGNFVFMPYGAPLAYAQVCQLFDTLTHTLLPYTQHNQQFPFQYHGYISRALQLLDAQNYETIADAFKIRNLYDNPVALKYLEDIGLLAFYNDFKNAYDAANINENNIPNIDALRYSAADFVTKLNTPIVNRDDPIAEDNAAAFVTNLNTPIVDLEDPIEMEKRADQLFDLAESTVQQSDKIQLFIDAINLYEQTGMLLTKQHPQSSQIHFNMINDLFDQSIETAIKLHNIRFSVAFAVEKLLPLIQYDAENHAYYADKMRGIYQRYIADQQLYEQKIYQKHIPRNPIYKNKFEFFKEPQFGNVSENKQSELVLYFLRLIKKKFKADKSQENLLRRIKKYAAEYAILVNPIDQDKLEDYRNVYQLAQAPYYEITQPLNQTELSIEGVLNKTYRLAKGEELEHLTDGSYIRI